MTPAQAAGPRLEVVRGARAGLIFPLAGEVVTVGRGSECQLRLDPEADLQASGRHAAFLFRGGTWCVCDLGSRNGTFVNGASVAAEQALRDGDVVTLGTGGPAVVYHAALAPATAPPPAPAPHARLLLTLAALLGLVVLGVTAFLYADRREQRAWEREHAGMQLTLDSLRLESERTEGRLRGEVDGLARALRGSRGQVDALRGELARAASTRDRGTTATLARRLEETGKTLHSQQMAASLDFAAIQRANRRATAVIYVEYDDGTMATATAFAVQNEGVLLTNRHAVLGADGTRRPRRMAIQFCDSEQIFPARLLATADAADLAAVAVEKLEGTVPVVRGLNIRADTLPADAPVALIGFPLGGDEPRVGKGGTIVRPILGAGTVRAVRPDRIELQGYGAEGASGSPIIDRAGEVVGILFGGQESAGGQILYAVPAATAARLLDALRRS